MLSVKLVIDSKNARIFTSVDVKNTELKTTAKVKIARMCVEGERFGYITLRQLEWDWGMTSGKRSKTQEKR
jgi:hypothetical protein